MTKEVIRDYGDIGSLGRLPKWANNAILAGAYQQGRAEAYRDAYDKLLGKFGVR